MISYISVIKTALTTWQIRLNLNNTKIGNKKTSWSFQKNLFNYMCWIFFIVTIHWVETGKNLDKKVSVYFVTVPHLNLNCLCPRGPWCSWSSLTSPCSRWRPWHARACWAAPCWGPSGRRTAAWPRWAGGWRGCVTWRWADGLRTRTGPGNLKYCAVSSGVLSVCIVFKSINGSIVLRSDCEGGDE